MRLVLFVAVAIMTGTIVAPPASSAPAIPFADFSTGNLIKSVEWTPETRHYDHHFLVHQGSRRHVQPTELERRTRAFTRYGAPCARNSDRAPPRGVTHPSKCATR